MKLIGIKKYILFLFFIFMSIRSVFADHKVGETSSCFFDSSRKRPLWVYIWYPCKHGIERVATSLFVEPSVVFQGEHSSNEKKHPLIIFSHGSSGSARDQIWLAESLVKMGNIVVSIEHYGNNWKNEIPELYFNYWERPKDVSFVLDCLLSSPTKNIIDEEKIGFAGFSLGGMTGIWLAGGLVSSSLAPNQSDVDEWFPGLNGSNLLKFYDDAPGKRSYKDPRIKAFFLMSPRSEEFSKGSTANIKTPFFIVFGDSDEYLPIEPNGIELEGKFPRATFHVLEGGISHYTFTRRPTTAGNEKLSYFLHQDLPGVDRHNVHSETKKLASDFFEKVFTY